MNRSTFKKALPSYLLLIILPIIFGLFLYYSILKIDKKYEIENIKSELSEKATGFIAKTSPSDYFRPFFQNFVNDLLPLVENRVTPKSQIKNLNDVSQEIKKLSQNLGENVRCALFDNNMQLLNPDDLIDYEIRFFNYLWQDIHNIKAEYEERQYDQYIIIGRDFNNELLRGKKEECITTYSLGKTGVIYIKTANEWKNGALIFVEYKRTNIELVQAKIKDYATFEHPIILYDLNSKKRTTPTIGHKEIPYSKTLTAEFLDGFIEDNCVWKGVKSDDYNLLFGQVIKEPNKYKNKLLISIAVFTLILILSTIFFLKNIVNEKGIYISIRYKLIFIFALAIYMPTLSLWVLSNTSLHDHRTAIENKVKKGMLDVLTKIDQDYKKEERNVLNSYMLLDSYLKSFKGKEPPKDKDVEEKIIEITGKKSQVQQIFNWVDIRNVDQSQIFTTYSKNIDRKLEKFGRALSVLCLDRYCPEKLNAAKIKPTQSDIIVGNLLENPITGFSSIFERPQKLNYLNFEGVGVYWWWNYYPELDNKIGFCIGTTALKFSTLRYFNSIKNQRYTFENTNLKIVNFNYITQEFVPEKIDNKELRDLINVSNINKTIESKSINYMGNKYLCLCLPGSILKDCFSLCMYPVSEIDYQIEKVRSAIYTIMILLLFISILTGSLLAKTFIAPVKELNKGLEALRQRNPETKIQINNKDELGHLGNAFNQMMSDIKDMLLAGAVQQCLIPTGKYKIEDYDCLVYNQMATDVGGDYADIFELPEDRLLVVIGDVTGHGVSSSLLTAMVKASIFRFANKNTPINEIVTNTSNMICDLLNKKKLMTFCAIILDKKTGELAICNAGHPYPIIKTTENGVVRIPSKTSLPMGLTKKRCRYNSETEVINPGEILFLYTDGFPEAEDRHGNEYGYDNFKNLIANCKVNNSEELKDLLIKTLKKHHGDAELADDITFIILRRKPFQNE